MFAVAAGGLAAGAAALIITPDGGGSPAPSTGGPRELTYQVAQFEEISTTGPQDVVVTRGDAYSVRSEGSPGALAQLEAVVEDGKLTIQPKGGFPRSFNWSSLASATFYVTLPRLKAVALAGSGDVRVDRVEVDEFEGTIAGSGGLEIADMRVDEADFTVNGSGSIAAAGTARDSKVSISGSGKVRAGALRSETASVAIGGSGDVALTVEDEASISIMGSGDVDISGPAQCSVTQMGSGDVSCSGGGGTDND